MMRTVVVGMGMLLLASCKAPASEQRDADSVMPSDGNAGLPPGFHGRWGLVPADCTSNSADAKGLLTVERNRLTAYESRASIIKLEERSPTELQATLAFTGEGQEWTQDTPLVLEDNGDVLTRIDDGRTLRYTRCGG